MVRFKYDYELDDNLFKISADISLENEVAVVHLGPVVGKISSDGGYEIIPVTDFLMFYEEYWEVDSEQAFEEVLEITFESFLEENYESFYGPSED